MTTVSDDKNTTFHYNVGQEKFYNKLQAIQENIKTSNPIHFKSPYGKADFSVEPQHTLDELMAQHLTELRNKFRKVKLYYSGGSDSHLLLHACIKNNIHIDEIVCLRSGIPTADFEIDDYAIPTLKKHANKLQGTKITIKTPTMEDYFNFYKEGVTDSKIKIGSAGTHTYFRLLWNLDIYGEDPEDRVLNMRGQEKPKILKHGSDYYSYHIDAGVEPHVNNYPFFSSNTAIQIKQCHMYLSTFKKLNHTKETYFAKETDIYREQKAWNESIGREISDEKLPHKNLYLGKNNNYIDFKGKKLYFSNNKDKLAISWCKENKPDLLALWYENVEQLKELTHNQWWNDNAPELNSVGVFTEFHSLTSNSVKTVDELFPDGFKNSIK